MKCRLLSIARKDRIRSCGFAGFLLVVALCFCRPALALDVSTFAGAEYDGRGQGFSFVGVDVTGKIHENVGISGRVMPNHLTYKYDSGNTRIKANSLGVFAVTGIKLFADRFMFGVYGGVESRNTSLSPDDRSARTRGHRTGGLIQGEIDFWFTRSTNVNVFGSYAGSTDFSYEKGVLKQQVTNFDYKNPHTVFLGLEQFVGRNADYRGEGVGATAELYFVPQKLGLGVRGGYKHDTTFGGGGYWGLVFYKGF